MSPSDSEKYFREITSFLHEYNFIFKHANTEILTKNILNKMHNKLEIKATEKIEYDSNEIRYCENKKIQDLLSKIEYFESDHCICMLSNMDRQEVSSRDLTAGSKSAPLGPKKRHEIVRMSTFIHELCLKNDCNLIIDLGSGLGYLSQHLHTIYNYKVLGIESDAQRLESAIKRQEKYHKTSIGKVKYYSHTITSHSNIYLQDLIKKVFPKDENICLIGLHACADLTVDAMKLFLNIRNAVGLVIMPCCYHKLSLLDFKHSIQKETIKENSEIVINKKGNTNIYSNDEALTINTYLNREYSTKNCHKQNASSSKCTLNGIFQSETGSQHSVNLEIDNSQKDDTDQKNQIFSQHQNEYSEMIARTSNDVSNSIHPTEPDSGHHIQNPSEADEEFRLNCMKNVSEMTSTKYYGISRVSSNNITETSNIYNVESCSPINSSTENFDISDEEICQHFKYFPLSGALNRVFGDNNACQFLRRPFLRLCCQPPSVDQPMDLLVFRLLSRAVLELYAVKRNASLVKKKRRAVKRTETTHCDFGAFLKEAVTNGYSLITNDKETSNLTERTSDWTIDREEKMQSSDFELSSVLKTPDSDERIEFNEEDIQAIWRRTENNTDLAAIYILLQRYFQPISENLLLYDRIVYLRENGCFNCMFVKITDEKISPRCMALIASK